MKTLTLHLPDSVEIDERDAKMLLASKLYERGTLSLGQAAELAGLSKPTFAEVLSQYDVSIFNYPASDLANDIANAKAYHI